MATFLILYYCINYLMQVLKYENTKLSIPSLCL